MAAVGATPKPRRDREMGTRYDVHMCWTKEGMVREIQRHGAKKVLENWTGTDYDAIEAIVKFPTTDAIPLGDCDDFDERGHCNGHPHPDEPVMCMDVAPGRIAACVTPDEHGRKPTPWCHLPTGHAGPHFCDPYRWDDDSAMDTGRKADPIP